MRRARGRVVVALATGGLAASGLTGCGLLDVGRSHLEEALEYLPAGITEVEFVDRAAMAERLGVDDVKTGADEAALDAWSEAVRDQPYGTELSRFTRAMQDAVFSELDLKWEARGYGAADTAVRVWKLGEEVDFGALADDLEEAGYERHGSGDAPRFTGSIDDLDGTYAQALQTEVQLVPDERLVITGTATDDVVDTVRDDADSLADTGAYGDLLDAVDDPSDLEYAGMAVGGGTCPGSAPRSSPEQDAHRAGLGRPEARAVFASEPAATVGVLLFEDADATQRDAIVRSAVLEDFASTIGVDGGFDGGFDVEQDGDVVRVTAQGGERPGSTLVSAWQRVDVPFGCGPER